MVRLKVGESRVYVIPIKHDVLKTPLWRRSKKAISIIKNYTLKHTKANKVIFSKWVNEKIWEKGGKHPPSKLKVKVNLKENETDKKEKIMVAHIELVDLPTRAAREKKKEAKKKSLREKLKDKLSKSDEDESSETTKEIKPDEKQQAKVTKNQELKMKK